MINIQIHIIEPQIAQARVDHPRDMLLAGNALFNLFGRAGQKFCSDHDVFPLCEILERTAQILLARAALVTDGRIKKIDAQFQPVPDDGAGMFLVQRPAVLAVLCIAEPHASHADAGNGEIGIAQFGVLHCEKTPFFRMAPPSPGAMFLQSASGFTIVIRTRGGKSRCAILSAG